MQYPYGYTSASAHGTYCSYHLLRGRELHGRLLSSMRRRGRPHNRFVRALKRTQHPDLSRSITGQNGIKQDLSPVLSSDLKPTDLFINVSDQTCDHVGSGMSYTLS